MKLKRKLKLKISGLESDINDYIRDQENQYLIAKTSAMIKHREDDECHVYLLIIPEVT